MKNHQYYHILSLLFWIMGNVGKSPLTVVFAYILAIICVCISIYCAYKEKD